MRSMTGYGRGVVEREDVRATVEVRSVNHRFLDMKLRGAALPAAVEDGIASRVRGVLERGAVSVSVHLAGRAHGLRIDSDAASRAHRMLADLAARLASPGPDLALVLAQPGVVTTGEAAELDGGDRPAVTRAAVIGALDAALAQLDGMRQAEGSALAMDLHARLDEMVASSARIAALAAGAPHHIARRLTERVKRLLEEAELDHRGEDPAVRRERDARIAQEVALLADRADVTEELVRLASHLDQARALLGSEGPVGRRLDFLVQEIGRELNTIGAKSTTAEIGTAIVGAKATLEKVREQVQNIE
ncbi:MAG TPA: YicC/YloC family endoribonuclease [Kofleriaceae bacterium]